jgi:hypothetical protein
MVYDINSLRENYTNFYKNPIARLKLRTILVNDLYGFIGFINQFLKDPNYNYDGFVINPELLEVAAQVEEIVFNSSSYSLLRCSKAITSNDSDHKIGIDFVTNYSFFNDLVSCDTLFKPGISVIVYTNSIDPRFTHIRDFIKTTLKTHFKLLA